MEIKVPKTCEVACVVKMKKSDKDAFVRAIDDEYRVHWSVDNLPVGKLECKEYDSIITDFFFMFPISTIFFFDIDLHVPFFNKTSLWFYPTFSPLSAFIL